MEKDTFTFTWGLFVVVPTGQFDALPLVFLSFAIASLFVLTDGFEEIYSLSLSFTTGDHDKISPGDTSPFGRIA